MASWIIYTTKIGKYYIGFKDVTKYLLWFPSTILKNIVLGDKIFNYIDKAAIYNLTNNLCSYVELNPDEVGFFYVIFLKQITLSDHFKGWIIDSSFVIIYEKGFDHALQDGA